MRLQELDELLARHPSGCVVSIGSQGRNALAPHRDHHALSGRDALEQVGSFVTQLSCGDFYDSATSVALEWEAIGPPWTWGSRNEDRAEVKELSGTNEVPILVLADGEVISGSGTIDRWAKEHPAARATAQS
jgi:hypothetical protein